MINLEQKRIVAIDYGKKRIGVAITDPLRFFAQPLTTLQNDHTFWNTLRDILSKYDIEEFVVGYPLKESGDKGELTKDIDQFVKTVQKYYKVPVVLTDERYSSGIAQERILESVTSKKKRRDKGLIDKNAAAVILEDYMKTL